MNQAQTNSAKVFWSRLSQREKAAAKIQSFWLKYHKPYHSSCDYGGLGGACLECGSLPCGCIDVCRCHVYGRNR